MVSAQGKPYVKRYDPVYRSACLLISRVRNVVCSSRLLRRRWLMLLCIPRADAPFSSSMSSLLLRWGRTFEKVLSEPFSDTLLLSDKYLLIGSRVSICFPASCKWIDIASFVEALLPLSSSLIVSFDALLVASSLSLSSSSPEALLHSKSPSDGEKAGAGSSRVKTISTSLGHRSSSVSSMFCLFEESFREKPEILERKRLEEVLL